MGVQISAQFCRTVGLAAVALHFSAITAFAQGINEKTLFFKEYFSQYPYQAILLPRPASILPGTVVFGDTMQPYLSPEECFEISDMKDFAPFVATRTSLKLDSSNWYARFNVDVDSWLSGSAEVGVSRREIIEEKDLAIKKQVLSPTINQLLLTIKQECKEVFQAAVDNSRGSFFIVDKLLTFTGELNSMAEFKIDGKAGVSLDTNDFIDKASKYPFLRSLADKLRISAKAELTAGSETAETILERFPIAGEGEKYEFLAFIPLRVSLEGINLIKERYQSDEEKISDVLNGQQDAGLFLEENPLYDIKDPKGLILRLYSGSDPVNYSEYTTETENQEISAQIADVYIINALAGRF